MLKQIKNNYIITSIILTVVVVFSFIALIIPLPSLATLSNIIVK